MKDDKRFLQDLRESADAVWELARFLHRKGVPASVLPSEVRPHVSARMLYQDQGDLEVRLKAECKHLSYEFTSAKDFPFPYIIVDEAYKIERKRAVWGYFVWSSDMRALAFIPWSTKASWTKRGLYDAKQKEVRSFYTCPLATAIWMRA